MVPQTMTELTEEGQINAMTKLLDMLEDNDDVQDVYHNWDMLFRRLIQAIFQSICTFLSLEV